MSPPRPTAIIAALARGHALDEWWPTDDAYHRTRGSDPRDEVAIGAVLVQNTAWRQVRRALDALKAGIGLDLEAIRTASRDRLTQEVRPAGFVTRKPATLQALARAVDDAGGMAALAEQADDDPDPVRRMLLEVHGIGEETADAILAYALDAPVFVVDAYTRRLMARLGIRLKDARGRLLHPERAPYPLVQAWWMQGLPRDPHVLRLAHAAIVHHGQTLCRKTPECAPCPLAPACPVSTQAAGG